MAAAPGIVTSGTGPPNAVVEIQPGMNAQPVVLVDQNGQYVTVSSGGGSGTATTLATTTTGVNVSNASAPGSGQVLTATSGTAATWQFTSGTATTANALNSATTTVNVSAATAPSVNQVLTATSGSAATWQFAPGGSTTTAGYLATTTTSVYVAGAAVPSAGQQLTAVNAGTATWQSGANAVLTTHGDTLYENATPALARLPIGSTNNGLFVSGGQPTWGTAITLLASTGTAGYPLINGTGTIVSWPAPNDGALHRVMVFSNIEVAGSQTDGAISVGFTDAGGNAHSFNLYAGGLASGGHAPGNSYQLTVEANTTLSITQSSAQTGGSATVWAELWGS